MRFWPMKTCANMRLQVGRPLSVSTACSATAQVHRVHPAIQTSMMMIGCGVVRLTTFSQPFAMGYAPLTIVKRVFRKCPALPMFSNPRRFAMSQLTWSAFPARHMIRPWFRKARRFLLKTVPSVTARMQRACVNLVHQISPTPSGSMALVKTLLRVRSRGQNMV